MQIEKGTKHKILCVKAAFCKQAAGKQPQNELKISRSLMPQPPQLVVALQTS